MYLKGFWFIRLVSSLKRLAPFLKFRIDWLYLLFNPSYFSVTMFLIVSRKGLMYISEVGSLMLEAKHLRHFPHLPWKLYRYFKKCNWISKISNYVIALYWNVFLRGRSNYTFVVQRLLKKRANTKRGRGFKPISTFALWKKLPDFQTASRAFSDMLLGSR